MLRAVSDMLDRIRRELDERLAALRPAADEFARLQRAADALDGLDAPAAAARPGASAPAPRAARTRGGRGTEINPAGRRSPSRAGRERAAPGHTQLRVMEQLRTSPGSSSTAVARALGISANAAAATISRLVKQGRASRLDAGGYGPAEPAADGDAAAADGTAAADDGAES